MGELLSRLTGAVARRNPAEPLSVQLCESYREVAGAEAAAITVHYETSSRVTLCTTNAVARRLEDLQDVLGEGPGHTASTSGRIELCAVPAVGPSRWPIFVEAAQDLVDSALIRAVPMQPASETFGVITLYQTPCAADVVGLSHSEFQVLANVVGAALMKDDGALDETTEGPWSSRAQIHQATGMVVAQMHVRPGDALAVLRAHAFGQQATLADVAAAVVDRRIGFPDPDRR